MHYTFTAETITPLLIAGAKGAQGSQVADLQAEGLRPASVGGELRYWFRAMMGGIVGNHNDYKTLQRLEAGIFGLTENSSSVRLRIRPASPTPMPVRSFPVRMNDQNPRAPGIANPRRRGIQTQAQFSMQVGVDRNGRGEEGVVLGTLWLLAALGGVGGRIRRSFGSLALIPEVADPDLDFTVAGDSLQTLARAHATHLTHIRKAFERYGGTPPTGVMYQHFVLCRPRARLWLVSKPSGFWPTWEGAMTALRDDVYRPLKTHLGIVYPRGIGSGAPRQASPLWFQVKRNATGGYFGVMLAFDTQDSVRGAGFHYFADPANTALRWGQLDAFMGGLKTPTAAVRIEEVTLP